MTMRAPVLRCLGAEVDGVCGAGDGLGFAGLGGIQGSDFVDCCLGTLLLIGSFAFS